jgi:two-component system, OmpR family, response regulator
MKTQYPESNDSDHHGARSTAVDTEMPHVLMFDDDPAAPNPVSDYLKQNDFRVTTVSTAREVVAAIDQEAIDLLVLAIRRRAEVGLALTRTIRESSGLPIVIVTGGVEEADRVMGLEFGADDYVTKPFSLRELLARIRAVLRRSHTETVAADRDEKLRAYIFAGWELNVRLHRLVSPQGASVDISRGEFSLLCAFLSAPQRVLTRDQLLERSRLHSTEVYDRSIDVQILRLRRKIEAHPTHPLLIRTERRMGYIFSPAVKTVR